MVDVLGKRRIAILGMLAVFAMSVAASIYLYLIPEHDKLKMQVRVVQSQVATKRGEISTLQEDREYLGQKLEFYRILQKAGLFNAQSRVEARDRIADLQQYSGIISASYKISSAKLKSTDLSKSAGHVMLNSNINVTLEALSDIDIYKFAYWLQNTFPGYVTIHSVDINRVRDVDDETLKVIGNNGPITMVRGELEFAWQSLVPEDQVGSDGTLDQSGRL